MADQTPPRNGNGRESLTFSLGGRTVAIQTGNLTTIFLLIILGGGGYLLYASVDTRLKSLQAQHESVIESLHTQTETLLRAVHEQRAFVLERMGESRNALNAQTETIRKLLLIHEMNATKDPAERLPLELGPHIQEKLAQ